jgi:RHS repeat-associated protein
VVKGGADTRFLYDGDALVAEYDSGGNLTNRYVHGSNAAGDDPLVWYVGPGTSAKRFLHADHLGSIVAVTNSSGGPTINTYDEYGIPGANNNGRFQYTGQAWLGELGMYYYKARIYSPTMGRFLQIDPVGYEGGINIYAYTGDDPINENDPTGNQSCGSRLDNNDAAGCFGNFTVEDGTTKKKQQSNSGFKFKVWVPEKPLEEDWVTTAAATGIFGLLRSGLEVGTEALGLKLLAREGAVDSARLAEKMVLSDGSLKLAKGVARQLAGERSFIRPLAIREAVQYGTRFADPQGAANMAMYRIGYSWVKGNGAWSNGMLEVLVNEQTGFIGHVLYKRMPWP